MREAAAQPEARSAFALRMAGVCLHAAGLCPGLAGNAFAHGAPILREIDLALPRGATLTLIGESGGGKSALLRLVNRLSEASAGRIEVLGRAVHAWAPGPLRRAAVLVPQAPRLLGGTIEEEIARPLVWANEPVTEARIARAWDLAQLGALSPSTPSERLSGGEKARVAIARALVLEPPLLMLDEPNAALDRRLAAALLGGIARAWRAAERTLIVVTHRLEALETLGGKLAAIAHGRLHGPIAIERLLAERDAAPPVFARLLDGFVTSPPPPRASEREDDAEVRS